MIRTDKHTAECVIRGTISDIEDEITVLLANILHELIIPQDIDPTTFLACVCTRAMEIQKHPELFTGRSIRMVIPRMEDTEDDGLEQS